MRVAAVITSVADSSRMNQHFVQDTQNFIPFIFESSLCQSLWSLQNIRYELDLNNMKIDYSDL